MAQRRDGEAGGSPQGELLTDLSVDEAGVAGEEAPQAPAGAGSATDGDEDAGAAPAPAEPRPAPPALEARLRRIESHLESLIALHREAPAGTARPGGGDDGPARDATAATPEAPEALLEELKLARSNLVGLSERVESLERGMSEKVKPIEEAAEAVRETTKKLAATGKRLDTATRGIDSSLWATGRIEDSMEMLRRYAFWWTVVGLVVAGSFLIGIVGSELAHWLGLP